MRKNVLICLILMFALVLTGCGGKDTPAETTAAAPAETAPVEAPALGLAEFSLSTSTWSSPNGATVHLSAVPNSYDEDCSVFFVVRLEGDEVAKVPCTWDGQCYSASADLNAADGLCYYVTMTAANGSTAEIPVNTPNAPTDEALIDLASALESYCHVMVEESVFADGKLTITAGSVQVQVPRIANDGETVTVKEAALSLNFGGEEQSSRKLDLTAEAAAGSYALPLKDITFDVPPMENDQQLLLTLNVTLSNGQLLSAAGGTFFYNDGALLTAVG